MSVSIYTQLFLCLQSEELFCLCSLPHRRVHGQQTHSLPSICFPEVQPPSSTLPLFQCSDMVPGQANLPQTQMIRTAGNGGNTGVNCPPPASSQTYWNHCNFFTFPALLILLILLTFLITFIVWDTQSSPGSALAIHSPLPLLRAPVAAAIRCLHQDPALTPWLCCVPHFQLSGSPHAPTAAVAGKEGAPGSVCKGLQLQVREQDMEMHCGVLV